MRRLLATAAAAIMLGAALVLLTGCGSAASEAAAQSAADTPAAKAAGASSSPAGPLKVTVVNQSGRDIRSVVVYGNGLGKDLGYGTVTDGDREQLTHDDLRAPKKLHLDYTDYRGDRKYNAVAMPRQFTDGYAGNVTLTVGRSGQVRVSR
ncbi:MAG: hypothetical protein AAGI54_03000 [Planctomycetota bacterium]